MSEIELIEMEGLLSKRALRQLKKKAKVRAQYWKRKRRLVDSKAREVFKVYLANGKSWKGKEQDRAKFRNLMSKRHSYHEHIARLVPEKVEPEWDSP